MTKGMRRCTTARPRCSNSRARFVSAGHQGLVPLIEDKDTHETPVLSASRRRGPLTGLVALRHEPVPQTPLATVGLACSAPGTARHPDELLTSNGRAAD